MAFVTRPNVNRMRIRGAAMAPVSSVVALLEQFGFLPERDYVTFGSLLSQFRLSSVTLVHPTQGVEPFSKISSPLCTLTIL